MEQKKAICRLTEKFKGLLQKSKKNPNRVSGASLKTSHLKKELARKYLDKLFSIQFQERKMVS